MKLKIENLAEKVRIDIYDEISHDITDFWTGEEVGVNAKVIKEQLDEAKGKELEIHINSNGGEVFEGLTIYNLIKNYEGVKSTIVDGMAASIASVIALSGDTVKMNKASMMMIHNASTMAYGNADDLEEVAGVLRQVSNVIRDIYQRKTNLCEAEIEELMKNETYMNADEALSYGFIDEIIEDEIDEEKTQIAKEVLSDRLTANIKSLQHLRLFNSGVKDNVIEEESENDISTEEVEVEEVEAPEVEEEETEEIEALKVKKYLALKQWLTKGEI